MCRFTKFEMSSYRHVSHQCVRFKIIIQEIKAVTRLLPQCKFQHVRREANGAAHQLAHGALRTDDSVVLRMDMPDELRNTVIAEAAERGSPDPCNSSTLE
jgi:hypothetical protein